MEGAKEGKVGGTGEAGATKQREEGERWSVGRPVLPFGNEICVRAASPQTLCRQPVQRLCAYSCSMLSISARRRQISKDLLHFGFILSNNFGILD